MIHRQDMSQKNISFNVNHRDAYMFLRRFIHKLNSVNDKADIYVNKYNSRFLLLFFFNICDKFHLY